MTTLTLHARVTVHFGGPIMVTGILSFDHPARVAETTVRYEEIEIQTVTIPLNGAIADNLLAAVQAMYPRATVAWATLPNP
jgi:hypothetical protein